MEAVCSPLKLHEQVITLWAATHKAFVHVETKKIKQYQKELLEYFDNVYPEVGREINESKQLSDELGEKILQIAEEFRSRSAAE